MKKCTSNACIDQPLSLNMNKYDYSTNLIFKKLKYESNERPLYRTEIGRISWDLLYYYSVIASINKYDLIDNENIINFIDGYKQFFPCEECKEDFIKNCVEIPYNNKITAFKWVCQQHNIVNKKLNKKLIDCENFDIFINKYNY